MKLLNTNQRNAFCFVGISPIRSTPNDSSEQVSQLVFGEVVEVLEIKNYWVKIKTLKDAYEGFVDYKHLIALSDKELRQWLDQGEMSGVLHQTLKCPWGNQIIPCGSFIGNEQIFNIGTYKFEKIVADNSGKKGIELATALLNTPYLWGGKSSFGIDCSGFSQLIFRSIDLNLPRDAYQQEELGQDVSFQDREPMDLAFFSNEKGKITHVGIIMDGNSIIHASGRVRIDTLKQDGIWNEEMGTITHKLTVIKRLN
jgi:hypothetical protein